MSAAQTAQKHAHNQRHKSDTNPNKGERGASHCCANEALELFSGPACAAAVADSEPLLPYVRLTSFLASTSVSREVTPSTLVKMRVTGGNDKRGEQ